MRLFVLLLLLIITLPLGAFNNDGVPAPFVWNFTPEEYGASRQNWSIIQDQRGIMYFGNQDGVLEFDGTSWRLIPLPDGSGAYSLAIGQDGRIYVGGTGEIGFLAPDIKGTMRYVSLTEKIPPTFRNFMFRINEINISSERIVFLSDKLLFVLHDDVITVTQSEDYFFSSVFVNQNLYVIDGIRGLLKLQKDSLQVVPGGTFFRSYLMLPFQKDNILIMTPDRGIGIFYTDVGRTVSDAFTLLSKQNQALFRSLEITSAVILNSGSIALGTIRKGCIFVDSTGRQELQINESNGLLCNDVYAINLDERGNIWLGLDCGISFIKPGTTVRRLQQIISDSITGVDTTVSADTIKSYIFTAMIRGVEGVKDDSLIFGGAFYKTPSGVQTLEQTELLKLVFPYNYNAFRISYSSNYFEDFGEIEYQTLLEGLDKDWMKWSNRTMREYTSLYWGKYIFRVRAKNQRGEISQEATYSFHIKTPWFESWWFYGGQISLLISILFISGFLRHLGKAAKLSAYLTTIVVIVLFKYLHMQIGPFIGMFSSGIAFFKIVMSVILGFVINPAQGFTERTLDRIINRYRK